MPYTVTIKIAEPGTPLKDGTPSTPGHMWYSISDGNHRNSYGFAPIEHGAIKGKGQVTADDGEYRSTYYQRTLEISKEQYEKLKEFGDTAKAGKEKYTSLYYLDVRHNCVDFTWGALNHAGIHTHRMLPHAVGIDVTDKSYEGSLKPTRNMDDVQRIKAPLPKSELNKEDFTPMQAGEKKWYHRLLSEEQKGSAQLPDLAQNQVEVKPKTTEEIIQQRVLENLRLAQQEAAKPSRDLSA